MNILIEFDARTSNGEKPALHKHYRNIQEADKRLKPSQIAIRIARGPKKKNGNKRLNRRGVKTQIVRR